jgi:hypothetical protein
VRFVHIADVHLGVRPVGARGREFLDLQLQTFAELCRSAEQSGAEVIVSAGDLFDSNRVSAEVSSRFAAILRRHPALTFVLLPGGGRSTTEITGHDAYTADSVYHRTELAALTGGDGNVRLLTPESPTHTHNQVLFSGGFFALPAGERPPQSAAVWHIGVVHAGIGRFGELQTTTVENADFDYLAFGHYHRYQRLQLAGGGDAVYPGPLLPFEHSRESVVGSYMMVELAADRIAVEHVALEHTPRFVRAAVVDDAAWQTLSGSTAPGDSVLITAYPEELHGQISAACDSDQRFRLASDVVVFAEADALAREAIAELRRQLQADADSRPDPGGDPETHAERLRDAEQLVLTLLRTHGGSTLERMVLDDLEQIAARPHS